MCIGSASRVEDPRVEKVRLRQRKWPLWAAIRGLPYGVSTRNGPHLRLLRQTIMEQKFVRHYRRMLPALLETLQFRSDNPVSATMVPARRDFQIDASGAPDISNRNKARAAGAKSCSQRLCRKPFGYIRTIKPSRHSATAIAQSCCSAQTQARGPIVPSTVWSPYRCIS
jgi:hypothetical protein